MEEKANREREERGQRDVNLIADPVMKFGGAAAGRCPGQFSVDGLQATATPI